MEDAGVRPRSAARREPIRLTLADLSMLVVGFASVFALPRLHHLSDAVTIGPRPMPGWVAHLFVAQEPAMKGCLVLAHSLVARRARYGGLP